MKKIQKHIEIVRSGIPALSSLSQESCDALYTVLAKHYAVVGVSTVNTAADLEMLVSMNPDLVFTGVKFVPDLQHKKAKVWVSEYLEAHNIQHIGSPKSAIELELNKPLAKQQMLDNGVKTSPFIIIKDGDIRDLCSFPLQFPVFIKPACLGGGEGINSSSVVRNSIDLVKQINWLHRECPVDILVEQYLPGREFSVAVLENEHSGQLTCMPIELVAPGNTLGDRILSEAVKSANAEVVLAVTELQVRADVIDTAARVFKALGARDYGRIDIRLDDSGTPYFLEANLIPSLIDGYGSFPKACALNVNLNYEAMILRIVNLGFRRVTDNDSAVDPDLAVSSSAVTV